MPNRLKVIAKLNAHRGFTMIELLIVLVIVSILAATAYQVYTGYTKRVHRTEVQAAMQQIAQKLAAYKLANNNYDTTVPAIWGSANYPLSSTGPYYYSFTFDNFTSPGNWTLSAQPIAGSTQAGDGTVMLNDQGWHCWVKASDVCTLTSTSTWDGK